LDLACKKLSQPEDDDYYMARTWASELAKAPKDQQIYAKKAINDILCNAQLGLLSGQATPSGISPSTSPSPSPSPMSYPYGPYQGSTSPDNYYPQQWSYNMYGSPNTTFGNQGNQYPMYNYSNYNNMQATDCIDNSSPPSSSHGNDQ
jgi:hypothetical protein